MATIKGWDNSNCVFALPFSCLRNNNYAAANAGTCWPAQGPSGGAITATLTNMAAGYGYQPQFGGVCRFDGVDDRIETSHFTDWTNANEASIELWVFFDAVLFATGGGTQVLWSEGDDGNNFAFINVQDAGKIRMFFYVGGAVDQTRSSDRLTQGWNHVVCVKDGATMRIYIDGSEVAYDVHDNYNLGAKTYSNEAGIGAYYDGAWKAPTVLPLAWFAQYDTAFTPARIAANYALGRQMAGIRATKSGNNSTLSDPADDAPTIVSGNGYKLGDKTKAMAIISRSEFNSSAQTYVPLPIDLSAEEFDPFWNDADCPADGNENRIRFATEDRTEIPADITGYSKSGQTGIVWLRHPSIPNGTDSDQIIMQWGGTSVRGVADTTVWDNCYGGSIDYISAHHLDEAGGNAIDAAGHYDGTVNGATQDQTGKIDQGYDFDGNNDNVTLGDVTQLNSVAAFSLRGWFNQDVLDVADIIAEKAVDADNNIRIETTAGGNLQVSVESGGDGYGVLDYSTVAFAGAWVHYCVVYDGTGVDNAARLKLYLNGVLQTLAFTGAIPATTANLAGNNYRYGSAATAFDGTLDELSGVVAALTAAQDALHYDYEDTVPVNAGWDVGGEAVKIPGVSPGNSKMGIGVGVSVGL